MSRHRLLLLFLCTTAIFASACGDSSGANTTLDPIPMSLSLAVPRSSAEDGVFAALEYSVSCDADVEADSPLQRATFESRYFYRVDPRLPTDVWLAPVEAKPGDCIVTFYGLADNDERVCVGSETFTVVEDILAPFLEAPCVEPS